MAKRIIEIRCKLDSDVNYYFPGIVFPARRSTPVAPPFRRSILFLRAGMVIRNLYIPAFLVSVFGPVILFPHNS